jgi:hypothetical protein
LADRGEFAPSTIYRHVELGAIPSSRWRGITVISETDAKEFLSVKPQNR